jgi:hypothetical protein
MELPAPGPVGLFSPWMPSTAVAEGDRAAATSSSPASSMNGIFCFWALRIFFCIRSSEESTSTRMPFALSWAANSSRYGTWPSPIGMPTTCTGASQAGKAPA